MSVATAESVTTEDLPRVVPIFPLPGVLLLPRGRLPLNIFEKRYLQMTEDAMGSHRMIGMVQPSDPTAPMDHPDVYGTGCIGRITSYSETPDDRYLITLTGVCRFRILREIDPDDLLYRRVQVSYDDFVDDLTPPGPLALDRDSFIPALKCFFAAHGLTADWDAVDQSNNDALVTCLAMACPFKPNEKQALLECPSDAERTAVMQALFEMAAHEQNSGGATYQ